MSGESTRPEPERVLPEQPCVDYPPAPCAQRKDIERADFVALQTQQIDDALAFLLAASVVNVIAGAGILQRLEAALWPRDCFPRSRQALTILTAPPPPLEGGA